MKKKLWFAENVEKPMESDMLCIIDGEMHHLFTKNESIGNLGNSFHNANDDKGLYDVTDITSWYKVTWAICLLQQRCALHKGTTSWW